MFLWLLLVSKELLIPSGFQSHLQEIQCKIQCRFSTESFPPNCRLSLGYCYNTHFSLESGLRAQESLACGWEDSWVTQAVHAAKVLLNILPRDSEISYALLILTTIGFWIISPNSMWVPGNENHFPVSVVGLRICEIGRLHPLFQPPPHPCHVVVSKVVVGWGGVGLARTHGIVANVYPYLFPVLLKEAQIMQLGSNYRLY